MIQMEESKNIKMPENGLKTNYLIKIFLRIKYLQIYFFEYFWG